MNAISIEFNNQSLTAAFINETPCVAMKPICENLGLQWEAQLKRIKRNPILNETMSMMDIVAEDGKLRQMVMLPIKYLNGWLFGVDVNRVSKDKQGIVIKYQRECFDVLANYFLPKTPPVIENPKAPRAKTYIPGGFTCEEQDIINDFIAERVAPLPKAKQPKAVMNMRSALVSKWDLKGVKHGYKNIPSEHFTNALNLMARVELDGDNFITIPKDELNLLVQQEIKAIQGDLLPKPVDNVMTINISNDGVVKSLSLKFECNEFKTGRWLVSQDNGNVSIQHLPDDVCVFSFQQWIQYAKQERGYVVLRKDEVVTKLVA